MIVVSNTSPLTNLAAVGQFHLLERIYGNLVVAQTVFDEIVNSQPGNPGAKELQSANWITVKATTNATLLATLETELDKGEAETLALAVELGADLVLLDEKRGRKAATQLGLTRTGIVGILLEAKKQGLLTTIQPVLDSLRNNAKFWLSKAVYDEALRLAGETPP